jgi:transposase
LQALADALGRPITFFLTAGQTSDYIGARALLGFLPKARALLAGCGYDADWLRKALIEREIIPCIPGRKARKLPVEYDSELYKERRRIENMFGRRKDWRRIATRYDRCADLFLSACCLAAVVLYWL